MHCTNCGTELRAQAEFCEECGSRASASAQSPAIDRRRAGVNSMGLEEMTLMKGMTDAQKMMFESRMSSERKSTTVGAVLAFFLGGVGAHRFYLGQIGLGILYAVFVWTFVPAVVALVETFMMPSRVRQHNWRKATEVAAAVRAV